MLNPLEHLRSLGEARPPLLAFRPERIDEFDDWKRRLRTKLRALLGELPGARCELSPQVTDEEPMDGFLRQRVLFRAEEGAAVSCYVLVPAIGSAPYPCIACIHGHGRGKDDVVGIAHDEADRAHLALHNYDYARQLARRGYLCVCPDMTCFGERADPAGSRCGHAFLNALMLGRQLKGMQLWDVLRTIDYAVSRDDVDPGRIGCVGLSMGAELTMYAALFDERIRCIVCSGFLRAFREEIHARCHCSCSYVPGLLKWMDFDDIGCALAPTPLLIEAGRHDTNTPIRAALEACRKARDCYERLDLGDRIEIDVFGGGHEFSGRKAYGWLDRWLREGT